MRLNLFVLLCLVCAAVTAHGAERPVVEGVQSPAWVERQGRREPLAIGTELAAQDRVISGADARVLLRMPEGSLVKLGAHGALDIERLLTRKDSTGSVVTAALNVVQGAFRFTTQAAAKFRGRREVDVRIATITAGIRGTDLWGKAADDRDIVCLIEGRISVVREGERPFTMDEALSFYIAPKNAPALPVAPVSKEQLAAWAEETEIQRGAGAARSGGVWALYALELVEQVEAERLQAALREAGYPAQLHPVIVLGRELYCVRIEHLPSAAEARALGERLRHFPGVQDPRAVRM
jgi:hypothetical protein